MITHRAAEHSNGTSTPHTTEAAALAQTIADKCGDAKPTKQGWQARCPAHDDDRPSLSIGVGTKGVLLHCHRGCALEAILAALGLQERDLFPRRNGHHPGRPTAQITARYDYHTAQGKLLFQVGLNIEKLSPSATSEDIAVRGPPAASGGKFTVSLSDVS